MSLNGSNRRESPEHALGRWRERDALRLQCRGCGRDGAVGVVEHDVVADVRYGSHRHARISQLLRSMPHIGRLAARSCASRA